MPAAKQISRQLALLWASVAVVLVVLSPFATGLSALLWECPFKNLFGIPCPTCGAGRSAILLAGWKWTTAFGTYPLMACSWSAVIVGGLWSGLAVLLRRPLPRLPMIMPNWAKIGALILLVSNWVFSIATGV